MLTATRCRINNPWFAPDSAILGARESNGQCDPIVNRTAKSRNEASLRIIAGRWKGRRVRFIADGVRPTGDRVRETLFNWLAPLVSETRCLDMFAGTGALGLEALSRGAASVLFVERNPKVAARLKEKEANMTQDDKKTYLWTAGILGILVALFAVSYALGLIAPPPA